ncbi:nickel pincer cofactor biosynthesis protein LarB [Candidatus Hodarchaeum mangrovi]
MNEIEQILSDFKSNKITLEEAKKLLRLFSLEFIENEVTLDSGRFKRKGIPEVIYAEKKSPETVRRIIQTHLKENSSILVSRVLEKHLGIIKTNFAEQYNIQISPQFEPYSVIVATKDYQFQKSVNKIGILTAGTSDIPVAEEVKAIAKMMGVSTIQFNDVGIAGVHRIFEPLKTMLQENVRVIVAIAGMEGALPAIVTSLVQIPVIGVPTSVGYGYGGKGEAALLTMLQTCSPGLVVVNIDNGINAGATAALIIKQIEEKA